MSQKSQIHIVILLLVLNFNCKSSNQSKSSDLESYNALKEVIISNNFKFIAETAYPMLSNDVIETTNVYQFH